MPLLRHRACAAPIARRRVGCVSAQRFRIGHVRVLSIGAAGEATRAAGLNGSLTIIVLTPLTTFSRARSRRVGKCMDLLEFFHRGVGSSKGPNQARGNPSRALPCLALTSSPGPPPRPDADAGHAAPGTHDFAAPRTRCCAGPRRTHRRAPGRRLAATAAAPTRTGPRRRVSAASRPTACPPRTVPPLRLRLAQSQAQAAEILSGPGEAEAAGRSRQRRRRLVAASVSGPRGSRRRLRSRQQDAAAAGDGRHRARPAARASGS